MKRVQSSPPPPQKSCKTLEDLHKYREVVVVRGEVIGRMGKRDEFQFQNLLQNYSNQHYILQSQDRYLGRLME